MKNKLVDTDNKDFNLQVGFKVKEASTGADGEVVVIEGYANFAGNLDGAGCEDCYVDRANEVVVPSGMDVSNYKKNPVILLNHNRSQVIGKALAVTKKADGIFIKAEIHAGACDEETFYAIKNGLIQTFSTGFRTKAVEYKEINKTNVLFITKSELFETSCVTIPCNAASGFSVIKSFADGTEGFYAGDFSLGTNPAPTGDVHITNLKEVDGDTMKLKLRDLLTEDKVKEFEALGLTEELDALKEIDTKSYIDSLVAKAFAELKAELEKVKEVKEPVVESTEEDVPVVKTDEELEAERVAEVAAAEELAAQEVEDKEAKEAAAEVLKSLSAQIAEYTKTLY